MKEFIPRYESPQYVSSFSEPLGSPRCVVISGFVVLMNASTVKVSTLMGSVQLLVRVSQPPVNARLPLVAVERLASMGWKAGADTTSGPRVGVTPT